MKKRFTALCFSLLVLTGCAGMVTKEQKYELSNSIADVVRGEVTAELTKQLEVAVAKLEERFEITLDEETKKELIDGVVSNLGEVADTAARSAVDKLIPDEPEDGGKAPDWLKQLAGIGVSLVVGLAGKS